MSPEQRRKHRKFHDRLRAERGPASNYACVDCNGPAKEWSWKGGSGENFGSGAFVENFDQYEPRCQSCHRSKDAKGWKHPEEAIAKMRAAKLGRPLSEEHRRAISNSLKGRPRPEEVKRAISEGHKRRKAGKQEETA